MGIKETLTATVQAKHLAKVIEILITNQNKQIEIMEKTLKEAQEIECLIKEMKDGS